MNTKVKLIGIVALGVGVVLVGSLFRITPAGAPVAASEGMTADAYAATQGANQTAGVVNLTAGVVNLTAGSLSADTGANTPKFGAAGGSNFNQNDLTVGGVQEFKYSISMLAATGTPCAIQSPSATSSLRYAAARVASTSAAAIYFEFGKATTAFATTTLMGTGSLAANAQGTLIASSSLQGIDPTTTFAPNQWLVLKGGNSQVGGVCQAVFIAI